MGIIEAEAGHEASHLTMASLVVVEDIEADNAEASPTVAGMMCTNLAA